MANLKEALTEMLERSAFSVGCFMPDHRDAPHGVAMLDSEAVAAIVKFVAEHTARATWTDADHTDNREAEVAKSDREDR